MKRKILAICIILLLVAIPIGVAKESDANIKDQNNEMVSLELGTIFSDEFQTTEKLMISKEKLAELENIIPMFLEIIQSDTNSDDVEDIIKQFFENIDPEIVSILGPLLDLKMASSRALVVSSGHGYNFNPLKKNGVKIRKKISFWHYSNGKFTKDRTIILQPFALKFKVLTGPQIGFMTKFTGFYLFISRKIPDKSVTFFCGTARHINGLQFL